MLDGRGRGRSGPSQADCSEVKRKKVLLLHGNRQTGEILLGMLKMYEIAKFAPGTCDNECHFYFH